MKDAISTLFIMLLCIIALVLRNGTEDTVVPHKRGPKKRDGDLNL